MSIIDFFLLFILFCVVFTLIKILPGFIKVFIYFIGFMGILTLLLTGGFLLFFEFFI